MSNNAKNNIFSTVRRIAYNIRTLQYLKESGTTTNDNANIKQIYVKNLQWDPHLQPSQ